MDVFVPNSVDSSSDPIDFMLSAKRGLTAAKLFLRLALSGKRRGAATNRNGSGTFVISFVMTAKLSSTEYPWEFTPIQVFGP
jgi:hypothetical protein